MAQPDDDLPADFEDNRDEVFIDKASGKLARRPELDKVLLSANRAGVTRPTIYRHLAKATATTPSSAKPG